MKKGVLVLGVIYLTFGVLQVFIFSRLLGIYQSLSVIVPTTSYIFAGIFPISGISLLTSYFLKLKPKIYKWLLLIFLVLGIVWFFYVSIGVNVANNNVSKLLENTGI